MRPAVKTEIASSNIAPASSATLDSDRDRPASTLFFEVMSIY
jgi:hypothetical protein